MFELLLQADQALEQGRLDDAARRYGQVLDLESTNAIAVAGLARVAFERGDEESATILANRALTMDPESVVAMHVAQAIGRGGRADPRDEETERTLAAAHHLGTMGLPSRRPPGDVGGSASGEAALEVPDAPAGPGKPLPDLPGEPLREHGQIARQVAAAAAALHEQSRPIEARRSRVQATGDEGAPDPGPGERHRPDDPFAVAEVEAAIEAVDAFDALDAEADPGPAVAAGVGDQGEAGETVVAASDPGTAAGPQRASHRPSPVSEEQAEAEALREALTIVLETETDAAEGVRSPRSESAGPRTGTEHDQGPVGPVSAEPDVSVPAEPDALGLEALPADEPAAVGGEAAPADASAPPGRDLVQTPKVALPAAAVPDAAVAESDVESTLEQALAELLSNETVWEVASTTHSRAPLTRAGHAQPRAEGAGGPTPAGQETPAAPPDEIEPTTPAGEASRAQRRLPTDFRLPEPTEDSGTDPPAEAVPGEPGSPDRRRKKGLFGRLGGR